MASLAKQNWVKFCLKYELKSLVNVPELLFFKKMMAVIAPSTSSIYLLVVACQNVNLLWRLLLGGFNWNLRIFCLGISKYILEWKQESIYYENGW